MQVAFQPIVGAESPTVWTSVGLISGGRGHESSSAGVSLWHRSGRSGAAIQSGGPLRLSAEGPRSERQGLVWLMERRGRDRDGLKEWYGNQRCGPEQQPNHATARNPFLNLMPEVLSSMVARQPWVWSARSGIEATASRVGRRSLPNSRIRPSIALPVNADKKYRSMIRRSMQAGPRMFSKFISVFCLAIESTSNVFLEGNLDHPFFNQDRSCSSSIG